MKSNALAILIAGALVASSIVFTSGDLSLSFFKPEWKKRLESRFVDAEDARYRNIKVSELTGWVCGEVNSKNRLGAYAGWQKFMVRPPFDLPSAPDLHRGWVVEIEGDYAAVLVGCSS